MPRIDAFLKLGTAQGCSDIHLAVGVPPMLRMNGDLMPIRFRNLGDSELEGYVGEILTKKQGEQFRTGHDLDFSYVAEDGGRFRVNVFRKETGVGAVFRAIPSNVPTLDSLNLPPVVKRLLDFHQGMILVTGSTGTGKSTTLAAMIGYRNHNSYGHIITIEDPVEYVHEHRNCVITQREVGVDTDSWEIALKNTLRQAPDVILIGEIRDKDVMEHAIAFAETGHLAMGTLHANNANQAIDRIINFFPEERRPQLLMDLSLNLKAVVSQRLIPLKEGKGRAAAVEVLLNSPLIADLIFKGEIHGIKEIMKKSKELGMKTFDMALFDLFEEGRISYDDALRFADSMNEVRLMIKLHSKQSQEMDRNAGIQHLDIV